MRNSGSYDYAYEYDYEYETEYTRKDEGDEEKDEQEAGGMRAGIGRTNEEGRGTERTMSNSYTRPSLKVGKNERAES